MNDLLAQGLQLMAVGMGVVFLFLGVLVGIITLISTIIQKFEASSGQTVAGLSHEHDLHAVLTEAVTRYREDHHK